MRYKVAVVGVTGAVGNEMLKTLEQRDFPIQELIPLASEKSAGKELLFQGNPYHVKTLTSDSFKDVDYALFSAGGAISKEFAPIAAKAGAVVIDNTSAFRMDPDVPLVVPEVNAEAAKKHPKGIIANPNCSTIQMLVALDPLRKIAPLKRVVVSTYQSVSGAGARAIEELTQQAVAWATGNHEPDPHIFPHSMLFECLPQIGGFLDNGFTDEEMKMINETQKIFDDPNLAICATTIRVPVLNSHSESINVEFEKAISVEQARDALKEAPGVELTDEPHKGLYPLAKKAAGKDAVFVGRIRKDPSVQHGLALWVVADNLRKGAALNAVQIAEYLSH